MFPSPQDGLSVACCSADPGDDCLLPQQGPEHAEGWAPSSCDGLLSVCNYSCVQGSMVCNTKLNNDHDRLRKRQRLAMGVGNYFFLLLFFFFFE